MSNGLKEVFRGFGWELLDNIRQAADEKISDAEFAERIIGIEKATNSMLEVGVDEAQIIKMLQKHWDLRLSEATEFVESCKNGS